MKKKLAVIALAALLISAAGCNTNTNTQTSTEGTISITESSEFQSFIESAEKSEDTAESKNSEKTSKTEDSKAEIYCSVSYRYAGAVFHSSNRKPYSSLVVLKA